MERFDFRLDDFNQAIAEAKRDGQELWAKQALSRFAFDDKRAIPLLNIQARQKNNLTLLETRRTLH